MTLTEHMEKFLGQIEGGYKPKEAKSSCQVAYFANQPFSGAITYSTLGMSKYCLPMKADRKVRQELLLSAYRRFPPKQVASFLYTFAEHVISKKRALLRGDVVGPSNPIIPSVACNSIYTAVPTIFPEGFGTFDVSEPSTVFVWLVPLREAEATFVKKRGWSRFERLLEAEDPDIWDLDRPAII